MRFPPSNILHLFLLPPHFLWIQIQSFDFVFVLLASQIPTDRWHVLQPPPADESFGFREWEWESGCGMDTHRLHPCCWHTLQFLQVFHLFFIGGGHACCQLNEWAGSRLVSSALF